MPAPKVYSYIRFSTPDQASKGDKYRDSLRRQLERTLNWCKRNKLTLEDKSFRDLGISAFKGDNITFGRLGAFIDAVDAGEISKGSILVIESLDRMTRQEVADGLELFLGILRRGIVIVTLEPEDRFERKTLNEIQLIIAIVILSRAYNESATKANRVREAWDEKRRHIKERPLTKIGPSWLKLENGKWKKLPDKVALVRRVFEMATQGWGVNRIVKQLNQEKILTLRGKKWGSSSVLKILHNRATLGEFTPRHGRGGTTLSKRPPAGDMVPDYYPAILKETEFYFVQRALTQRTQQAGRQGLKVTNLFPKKLFSADGPFSMTITNKGEGPSLVSSGASRGIQGKYISFSYEVFERAFLGLVSNLKPEQIFPTAKASAKTQELATEQAGLAVIDHRLDEINKRIQNDPDYLALMPTVKKLSQQRKEKEARVEAIKGELASEQHEKMDAMHDLVYMVNQTRGDALIDLRLRLRAKITNLVERIDIKITEKGLSRTLTAVVTFIGGKKLEFWCQKIVRYSGGGSTNPKPVISYVCATKDKETIMSVYQQKVKTQSSKTKSRDTASKRTNA